MRAGDPNKPGTPTESKQDPQKMTDLDKFKKRANEIFESEARFETSIRQFIQEVEAKQLGKNLSRDDKVQFEAMLQPFKAFVKLIGEKPNPNSEFHAFKPNDNDKEIENYLNKLEGAMACKELKEKKSLYEEATAAQTVNTAFMAHLTNKYQNDPEIKRFLEIAPSQIIQFFQRGTRYGLLLRDAENDLKSHLKEAKIDDAEKENLLGRLGQLKNTADDFVKKMNENDRRLAQERESIVKARMDAEKNASLIHNICDAFKKMRKDLEKDLGSLRALSSENYLTKTQSKIESLSTVIAGLDFSGNNLALARKYLDLAKDNDAIKVSRGISASTTLRHIEQAIQKIDQLDPKAAQRMSNFQGNLVQFHQQEIRGLEAQRKSFSLSASPSPRPSASFTEVEQKQNRKSTLETIPESSSTKQNAIPPPPKISPEAESVQMLLKKLNALQKAAKLVGNEKKEARTNLREASRALRNETEKQRILEVKRSQDEAIAKYKAEEAEKVKQTQIERQKASEMYEKMYADKMRESDTQANRNAKEASRRRVKGLDIPPPPPMEERKVAAPKAFDYKNEPDFPPPPPAHVPPPAITPEEEIKIDLLEEAKTAYNTVSEKLSLLVQEQLACLAELEKAKDALAESIRPGSNTSIQEEKNDTQESKETNEFKDPLEDLYTRADHFAPNLQAVQSGATLTNDQTPEKQKELEIKETSNHLIDPPRSSM